MSDPGVTTREPPLAVDLDGTLIHTDSLYEGVLLALKRNPLLVFRFPAWLLRGKSAFKQEIASRAPLDAEFLPYNRELLDYLKGERVRRSLVLCTAADHRFAGAVAAHLGLFDECLATSGDVNLSASSKARALVERFGAAGFDYAGNDTADIPVFEAARRAVVVNPSGALRRRSARIGNLEHTISGRPRTGIGPYFRAMRPNQWVKNLLVFVPVLATFEMSNLAALWPSTLAFLAFSLVASSVYLMNDLFDLNADRRHPRKRHRPFASGAVPIRNGVLMIPVLLSSGFLIGTLISPLFLLLLLGYWISTTLYTLWLKHVPLLDTLVLAGLYTIRILAGAAAIEVQPSFWLLAFSMFLFLSLALVKRHSELVEMEGTPQVGTIPGREYQPEDLSTLKAQGTSSGYSAVLVLALFIDSASVRSHYRHPEIIWLICPLLLYWINKMWLNSQRRQINEDPVVWAMTNRVSRAIAFLSVVVLLLAKWLP